MFNHFHIYERAKLLFSVKKIEYLFTPFNMFMKSTSRAVPEKRCPTKFQLTWKFRENPF